MPEAWMLGPILVTAGATALAVLIVRFLVKRPDVVARRWVRWLMIGFCGIVLGALAVSVAVATVNDGVDRYGVEHGTAGALGTLRLERIVKISVGKPPGIEAWAGTFESDDGQLRRSVRLGEELPRGDESGRPGQTVRVRLSDASPDSVYLASETQAFNNWLVAQIFAVGFLGLMGGVAVVIWLRRRSLKQPSVPASNEVRSPPEVPSES